MTDIPQSELDALRKAVEAATPGEWTAKRALKPVDGEYDYAISSAETSVLAEAFALDTKGREIPAEANASYIAAFNPATGLRLLDRIAELEGALASVANHDLVGLSGPYRVILADMIATAKAALQSPSTQPGGGL